MHSNFVLVRSDSPSDDAAHSVVRRLIDFLSTNASLSPQTPLPGGQHQSPFFPAESGSGGQAESLVQPAVTPLEEEEAGDTVDGQTCDVSYVSEAGSVTPEADKPEPDLASMEPDGAGQSGKDPLSRLQEATIPVVCVVIQGDYNSARLVLDNLRRGNPVIVLRGSGGFADLLSYAHMQMKQRCKDLYHSWDAEFVESTLKPLLGGKIAKRFPHLRHNALARNILRDRIVECVRESHSAGGREYLTVLNMHNSSCDLTRLSEFILLSLFKSQNRRAKLNDNLIRKDLYLTLDWNCLHVALDDVLRRNPSYNLQLEKSIFEIALLRNNREDFVDLFLSHGFRVHKYLTPFRLKRLVRYSLLEQDFFRSVCMEAILGIAVWSANFDDLIEKLSPSLPNTESDCFLSHELNQLVFTTTSLHDFVNVDHLYLNIMGLYPVDEDSSERKALAILAMWAVFNRRFRLCEVLWKHSDQPIHLALTVSMMLQRMAWFVADQNLKNDLQAHGRMFEKYAIGVLDACYRQDEKRSFNLLSEENGDWGRKTVVDIAANGSHRNFIAHPCCQKWLTNTFNGRIRVRELNWGILTLPPVLKIVLSAFLVLPMYVWISFLEEHDCSERNERLLEEFSRESDESEEEIAKDHFRLVELDKGPGHKQSSGKSRLASVGRSGQSRYRPRLVLRKQPPLATMLRLMWTSPITKFWTYQVLYILYLAVFSLAVIWPGCGNWYLDATVCFWTCEYRPCPRTNPLWPSPEPARAHQPHYGPLPALHLSAHALQDRRDRGHSRPPLLLHLGPSPLCLLAARRGPRPASLRPLLHQGASLHRPHLLLLPTVRHPPDHLAHPGPPPLPLQADGHRRLYPLHAHGPHPAHQLGHRHPGHPLPQHRTGPRPVPQGLPPGSHLPLPHARRRTHRYDPLPALSHPLCPQSSASPGRRPPLSALRTSQCRPPSSPCPTSPSRTVRRVSPPWPSRVRRLASGPTSSPSSTSSASSSSS